MTPEKFKSNMKSLAMALKKNREKFNVLAALEMEAEMKKRIFQQGNAVDGKISSRTYSGEYKVERQKRNRQTKYVDLHFTGDMENSLTTGTQNTEAVLGFTNDYEYSKAKANEKRYRKEIFSPSKLEIDKITEQVRKAVMRVVNKNIAQWGS